MAAFSFTSFNLVTGETLTHTDESFPIFQNPDLHGEINQCLTATRGTLPRHFNQYAVDIPFPDSDGSPVFPGSCYDLSPNPEVGDTSNINPMRAFLGFTRRSRMFNRHQKEWFAQLQRYLQRAPRAERKHLEEQLMKSPFACYRYSRSVYIWEEAMRPHLGGLLAEVNREYDAEANDLGLRKATFKPVPDGLPLPLLAIHDTRPAPPNHRQLILLVAVTLARRHGLCPLPDPRAKYFIPEREMLAMQLLRLGRPGAETVAEVGTDPPADLFRAGTGAMARGAHPLPGDLHDYILRYTAEPTSFGNALFTLHHRDARGDSRDALAMLLIAIYDVNADEMWEGVEYLWENSPQYNFQAVPRPAHAPWAVITVTPEGRKLAAERQAQIEAVFRELPFIYTRQMRSYNQLKLRQASA